MLYSNVHRKEVMKVLRKVHQIIQVQEGTVVQLEIYSSDRDYCHVEIPVCTCRYLEMTYIGYLAAAKARV